jgi:plasmid stabilization system protein ParE
MPYEVSLTKDADRDLEEIYFYIVEHESRASAEFVYVVTDGRRDMASLLARRLLGASRPLS